MGEADKLRQEEKDAFEINKAEQEKGLQGVRAAIAVLKEYYAKADQAAHDAADGAASGIIGLLETVESDFTKTLAALMTEEESSAAEYDAHVPRLAEGGSRPLFGHPEEVPQQGYPCRLRDDSFHCVDLRQLPLVHAHLPDV